MCTLAARSLYEYIPSSLNENNLEENTTIYYIVKIYPIHFEKIFLNRILQFTTWQQFTDHSEWN